MAFGLTLKSDRVRLVRYATLTVDVLAASDYPRRLAGSFLHLQPERANEAQSVKYCASRLDDYRSMSNKPRSVSVPALDIWAPLVLAILRITTGLLLLEHGLAMVLPLSSAPTSIALSAAAGLIEAAGGLLITAGLYTRVAALICSAEMAMAWSALNLGDAAMLFCVVFFYLVFAGPGAWSMDAVVQEHR